MRIGSGGLRRGLLPVLACFVLAGCVPVWRTSLFESKKPVTDAYPPRDCWCYQTLGQIDCYTTPQDFPPDRLVNVSPAKKLPRTHDDYAKAVAESQ